MSPAAGPAAVPRIAVVGDIALDYYLLLAPQRAGDEKRTAAKSFRLPGGTGANAAAAAAVLGSHVTLHSVVGTDHLGQWLAESLASLGVDTRAVRTLPGSTTQATILLDGAGRQVIVDRGVADRLDELDLNQIGAADVAYVTGSSAAIRRIALAGNCSRVVAGIEAWMADDGRLGRALGNADLVVTNTAGWTSLAVQAASAVTVIETRGPDGAVIHATPLPDERVAAIPVDAVDATGAGDCFAGALCHYLASGLELTAACKLAVAAAGLSTRALGAQSALPTDTEVRAAAARHPVSGATAGEAT
ncbi:MAG: carbohydrate kinase family protein [Streptosporangiaceae bacterium]